MFGAWFNLAMLAFESQQVVGLRTWRIAGGGARASDEAYLMVSEKMDAARNAFAQLMLGATMNSIVSGYRDVVQTNVRRLHP